MRERAEDLCDGGAAEMTGGGRNQSLGLRRRASEWRGSDGRDRPRGELDARELGWVALLVLSCNLDKVLSALFLGLTRGLNAK